MIPKSAIVKWGTISVGALNGNSSKGANVSFKPD